MYVRLYSYFNENHLIYDYQFGFRKHYSTGLALLDVDDQLCERLDNHEKALGIYLDLQKAFDTVDHNILLDHNTLLYKLFCYGVRGTVYTWFENYLSDRKQYVCRLYPVLILH